MKFFAVSTIALLCACVSQAVSGAGAESASSVSPSDLQFHRLAVIRFVFDNNLDLCEFKPAKVVGFSDAYAVFAPSADDKPNFVRNFDAKFEGGNFVFASDGSQRGVYMGGVNPFACYSADIEKFEAGNFRSEYSSGGRVCARVFVFICAPIRTARRRCFSTRLKTAKFCAVSKFSKMRRSRRLS